MTTTNHSKSDGDLGPYTISINEHGKVRVTWDAGLWIEVSVEDARAMADRLARMVSLYDASRVDLDEHVSSRPAKPTDDPQAVEEAFSDDAVFAEASEDLQRWQLARCLYAACGSGSQGDFIPWPGSGPTTREQWWEKVSGVPDPYRVAAAIRQGFRGNVRFEKLYQRDWSADVGRSGHLGTYRIDINERGQSHGRWTGAAQVDEHDQGFIDAMAAKGVTATRLGATASGVAYMADGCVEAGSKAAAVQQAVEDAEEKAVASDYRWVRASAELDAGGRCDAHYLIDKDGSEVVGSTWLVKVTGLWRYRAVGPDGTFESGDANSRLAAQDAVEKRVMCGRGVSDDAVFAEAARFGTLAVSELPKT